MESKLVITPIDVRAGGESFKVRPFGFGQLPAVIAKLTSVMSALQNLREGQTIDLPYILEHGGDAVMDVVAAAIGRPRSFLDSLPDYDEGYALVRAVFEANRENFVKKVLPVLVKAMATVQAPAEKVAASASTTQ